MYTRSLPYLLLLPSVAIATACDGRREPATAPTRPVAVTPAAVANGRQRYDDELRATLERAASGLLYTSESDYPLAWFARDLDRQQPLGADTFVRIAGEDTAGVVEQISLDDFLRREIEPDPFDSVAVAAIPRWTALRDTLRAELRDVTVFRVGTIAVRCYAVGRDRFGRVVGYSTVSIET